MIIVRLVARILHGDAHEHHRHEISRAPGAKTPEGLGAPPPPPPKEILKKVGYLRQHFVRFEGYLFGNEAGKNEGSSNNNPGKCLNSKLIFSNRTL